MMPQPPRPTPHVFLPLLLSSALLLLPQPAAAASELLGDAAKRREAWLREFGVRFVSTASATVTRPANSTIAPKKLEIQGSVPPSGKTPTDVPVRLAEASTSAPRDSDASSGSGEALSMKGVRFVFDRTGVARISVQRGVGETRVYVSDGWLSLAEDIATGQEVARRAGNASCLPGFIDTAAAIAQNNLSVLDSGRAGALCPLPKLSEYVRRAQAKSCNPVVPYLATSSREISQHASVIVETGLAWWVLHELARLHKQETREGAAKVAENVLGDMKLDATQAQGIVMLYNRITSRPLLPPSPCATN